MRLLHYQSALLHAMFGYSHSCQSVCQAVPGRACFWRIAACVLAHTHIRAAAFFGIQGYVFCVYDCRFYEVASCAVFWCFHLIYLVCANWARST